MENWIIFSVFAFIYFLIFLFVPCRSLILILLLLLLLFSLKQRWFGLPACLPAIPIWFYRLNFCMSASFTHIFDCRSQQHWAPLSPSVSIIDRKIERGEEKTEKKFFYKNFSFPTSNAYPFKWLHFVIRYNRLKLLRWLISFS